MWSWPQKSAGIRWIPGRSCGRWAWRTAWATSPPSFPAASSSGGHCQAIAKNPKLLLCDEPTGALDYVTGKSILKLLQDTCRQQGMTVVVITHNSAIAPMADQVIHVKNGRVERIDHNDRPVPVETIEW